jgi:hypothetical protein
MLCTPFMAGQATIYNLKFVLMKRNIFDCLVSLDDFNVKETKGISDPLARYFWHPMPPRWLEMEFEERMHHLLDRMLGLYVHYFVSWRLLESRGWVKPFWISYEEDILGDKVLLSERLCDWLGRGANRETLIAEMDREKSSTRTNFNKGVAGRGHQIQGRNRQRVLDAFAAFRDLADCSDILD